MYRWVLDGPAQEQFADLNPSVRESLAAFMDAVVIVDPAQYQRPASTGDAHGAAVRWGHRGSPDRSGPPEG